MTRMGPSESSEDNTPPRSPDIEDNFQFDRDDIIEVIDLDDFMDVSGDEDDIDDIQVIPARDNAKVLFRSHTVGVVSCAFHPIEPSIVATGGMDDKLFVWDWSSSEPKVLLEETAKETVDNVKFSNDGQYLAASDLEGVIKIYNSKDFSLATEFDLSDEYTWLCWHQSAPVLLAATSNMVVMFNILTGAAKTLLINSDGINVCGKIFPDGKTLACASDGGVIKIIDMKTAAILNSVKVKSATGDSSVGISCMDIHCDGAVLLCGCSDGAIFIMNASNGKVSFFPRVGDSECVAIAYSNSELHKNLAASGNSSGVISFWDTSRQAMRNEYKSEATLVSMKWHPKDPIVFSCHINCSTVMVDGLSGTPIREFLGHSNEIHALDVASDFNHIVTVSEDTTARVFAIKEDEVNEVEMAS